MSRLVSTKDPGKFFFWSSVLALPVCLSAIRNGQANTPLAALMLLSAAALARGFWGRSAVLMMVALAIKQLALPLILLASISHRKLIPWCAGLLPVVVLAPLLFVDADWFLRQVQALGEQTSKQMTVREHRYRFTDINGLIRPLGLKLSTGVYIAVAMAAALALAAYWHIRSRDLAEPLKGLIVLSLAAIYLMLFNPMNESNSYIIAAPPLAILAIRELERARAKWTWLVLIGSLIAIGVLPEALRRVVPDLATWMKPLLILLCFGVVIAIIERERANADPADGGPVNDPSQDSHPTPA